MQTVNVYRQGPGAIDDSGGPIAPGWYWVRTRKGAPSIPIGRAFGPFVTKLLAEKDSELGECDACSKRAKLSRVWYSGIETFACDQCRGIKP